MKDTHKWTGSNIVLIAFNCLLCLAIIVSSMMIVIDKSKIKNGVVYSGKTTTEAPVTQHVNENEVITTGKTSARFMCAGDNLIHRGVYTQAADRAGGSGYDFNYAYKPIKNLLSLSDLAFVNQESVMVKENEVSSYPTFNSPPQVLDALINSGFDVFNQATNHALDQGVDGALSDINLFSSKNGILLTGLYKTRDEMLNPPTKVVNDIIFSFVSFTEYLNGNEIESDSDLGLMYLTDDRYTQDELDGTMKQMVQNAKKSSDIVCVSMHWNDENRDTVPDATQAEIVDKLLSYGADIIIGTGTHILQPMEFKKNGDSENALVIWSLGNLISCQSAAENMMGGIADITITKDRDAKKTSVSSAKLVPTIVYYSQSGSDVQVVPLADYTDKMADSHGINAEAESFTKDYINSFYSKLFGKSLEIKYK